MLTATLLEMMAKIQWEKIKFSLKKAQEQHYYERINNYQIMRSSLEEAAFSHSLPPRCGPKKCLPGSNDEE